MAQKLTIKSANLDRALKQIGDKIGKGGSVSVGFLEDKDYPVNAKGKSLKVATVAFWNEFGTSRAPARPFMRNTIRDLAPTMGDRVSTLVQATNYDVPASLRLIGEALRDRFIRAIKDWPADNAKRTVDKKGFNKGLIDTGVMQRSVDYRVDAK